MSESAKPARQSWLTALSIGVILASVALVAVPGWRSAPAVDLFIVASLANSVALMLADWKSGLLSLTPGQLLERARAGHRFPRNAPGLAAAVASGIALWQITLH